MALFRIWRYFPNTRAGVWARPFWPVSTNTAKGIQWTLHASPLAREYYGKVGWTVPGNPWIKPQQWPESRLPEPWRDDHRDLADQA